MNPYLAMDVRTSSPEVLIGRLLDRAVALVDGSIESYGRDPAASAQAITKAVDIVSELRSALRADVASELVENLDALYEFINRKLVLGCAAQEKLALAEALKVLETIAGGWAELLVQRTGAA